MQETKLPFAEVVRLFHEAKIRFIVIGGVALGAHGSNYATKDVDFAYAVDSENVERLAAFLPTIHARVLGRPANDNFVITAATLQRARFLNLFTDVGEVDVMREIAGVDSFEGLWERAVEMDFGGFIVRVASIDDLISMKRAANRPKDQAHIYELLALKKLIAEQEAEAASENAPDKEQYAGN
jgi:predicted nucleotidyltransferase